MVKSNIYNFNKDIILKASCSVIYINIIISENFSNLSLIPKRSTK